jgi:hypothetical protein
MHAAPPVRMSLGVDPGSRVFVIVCSTGAAANFTAWVAGALQQPATVVGAVALLSAAVAAALSRHLLRRRALGGVLAWDGATWRWRSASAPTADLAEAAGDVRIMIDLGQWLLLRFEPAPPQRQAVAWLAVSRQQAGAAWPQWRAVLFSRRGDARAVMPDPS